MRVKKYSVSLLFVVLTLCVLTLFSFGANVELSSYDIGDTVQISYNGTLTNFIVVHQGLPSDIYDSSCDGTWLMMDNVPLSRQWNSSDVNDFENSSLLNWLNTTFYNSLDISISPFIKQVKIPYRAGSGYSTSVSSGSNGLSTKIFLLSCPEVGWDSSYNSVIPDDGSVLDYFSSFDVVDSRRAATNLTGGLVSYWLRDPVCLASLGSKNASMVYSTGEWSHASCSSNSGVRPVFLLPSGLSVDPSGIVLPEYFEPEYSISVSSDGNGSVSSSVSTATAGTTVTLIATPVANYVFSEWQVLEGDIDIVNNQFIMPSSNVSVKAIFVPDGAYSVTVENDGNGVGSANPVRAEQGTRVTLSAVPVLGYEFDSWEVVSGSVNISNNQFIMPDSDVVVRAKFKPIVYTITLNQGSNGSATVSQTTGIVGDVITLTATPDDLYFFGYWNVTQGGITVENNQFVMPASNVVLSPVFIEQSAISSGFTYNSGTLSARTRSTFDTADFSFGDQIAGKYIINIYHWGDSYDVNFYIYDANEKYYPVTTAGGVSTFIYNHSGGTMAFDGSFSIVNTDTSSVDGDIYGSGYIGDGYHYVGGEIVANGPLSWTFNIENIVAVPLEIAQDSDYGIYSLIVGFLRNQFSDMKSFLAEQFEKISGTDETQADVDSAADELNKEVEDLNNLSGELDNQASSLEQQFTSDFKVPDEISGNASNFQLIYTGIFQSLGIFSVFIWLPVVFAVIKKLLRL